MNTAVQQPIRRFPSVLTLAASFALERPLEVESNSVRIKSIEREDGSGKCWNIKGFQNWGKEKVEIFVNYGNTNRSYTKIVDEFSPNKTFLGTEKFSTRKITWFPVDLEIMNGLMLRPAASQIAVPFQITDNHRNWKEYIYLRGVEREPGVKHIFWGYNASNKCLVRMSIQLILKEGTMEFFR